jgi:hypothetical protein
MPRPRFVGRSEEMTACRLALIMSMLLCATCRPLPMRRDDDSQCMDFFVDTPHQQRCFPGPVPDADYLKAVPLWVSMFFRAPRARQCIVARRRVLFQACSSCKAPGAPTFGQACFEAQANQPGIPASPVCRTVSVFTDVLDATRCTKASQPSLAPDSLAHQVVCDESALLRKVSVFCLCKDEFGTVRQRAGACDSMAAMSSWGQDAQQQQQEGNAGNRLRESASYLPPSFGPTPGDAQQHSSTPVAASKAHPLDHHEYHHNMQQHRQYDHTPVFGTQAAGALPLPAALLRGALSLAPQATPSAPASVHLLQDPIFTVATPKELGGRGSRLAHPRARYRRLYPHSVPTTGGAAALQLPWDDGEGAASVLPAAAT